jgi:hypothetical protein
MCFCLLFLSSLERKEPQYARTMILELSAETNFLEVAIILKGYLNHLVLSSASNLPYHHSKFGGNMCNRMKIYKRTTDSHTSLYIYIYIYIEREREREKVHSSGVMVENSI